MRATYLHGPGDVRLQDFPDPVLRTPGDAIVNVVASCVCGSDLWPYRGVRRTERPRRIGHEHVGVVQEVGAEVRTIRAGDFVVAPFLISDGTCVHCRNGITSSCAHGGGFGFEDADGYLVDGCQGELVRLPLADGTLLATPEPPDDALVPGLLALTDVMCTGHHAARVIAMSRHLPRQELAVQFGATDVIAERGEEGSRRVVDMLGGIGADCALECVGTQDSMQQAISCTRPGGRVGYVGVPASGPQLPVGELFGSNISVGGGVAPVRHYLPELLIEVWDGSIDPGPVFDLELPLADVAEAYAAMDERRAIKVLLRP